MESEYITLKVQQLNLLNNAENKKIPVNPKRNSKALVTKQIITKFFTPKHCCTTKCC